MLHSTSLLLTTSPYLLELGLSKATMAMVFMAGPIAGLLVQPVIGVMADQSTHRWGRRRPYLLASVLVCAIFVLLLGFARVPAALFGIEGATAALTVLGIWGLDFAVNAVMALDRSLILDMLPAEQQAAGNAWVARICSIGSILGFFVGDLDLPNSFPFSWLAFAITAGSKTPSEPQVRCLSLITASFMVFTHLVVIWAAVERRLERIAGTAPSIDTSSGVVHKSSQILLQSAHEFARIARQLSEPIKAVFKVQMFSWICWFPLLFYSTEWVSQTAMASFLSSAKADASEVDYEALRAKGTRAGSHAMFLQALLSFVTSVLLPLVLPPDEHASAVQAESATSSLPAPASTHASRRIWLAPSWLPVVLQDVVEGVHARIVPTPGNKTAQSRPCAFRGISLTTMWTVSHFVLACSTWFTWPVFTSQSLSGATFLITIIGFCWAITQWVPFALLGIFIQSESGRSGNVDGSGYESIPMQEGDEDREDGDEVYNVDGGPSASPSTDAIAAPQATQAGSVLGLHNIAIVIPQFLVSIAASILFALFEPRHPRLPETSTSTATTTTPSTDADLTQSDAVNVVFILGGVSSFAAGLATLRLSKRFNAVVESEVG